MKIEKYIRYWYRGSFVSEPSDKRLTGGDFPSPDEVNVPAGVYAFQFKEKHIQTATLEDGRAIEHVDWKSIGPTYYPGGVVLGIDEIAKTPSTEILRDNMRGNKWRSVVYAWPHIVREFDPATDAVIADQREVTREVWNREHPDKQCIPGR